MSDWVILRTAGRSTLALAASLAAAGYRIWTPTAVLERLRGPVLFPRRHMKREIELIPAPITPTYLFAGLEHIMDLLALSDDPGSCHDGFSVMRRTGGFAMVREKELVHLRAQETASQPKPKRRHRADKFAIGDKVRVPCGSFAGLDGVVEASDGRVTQLYFGGSLTLKIETFLLRQDDINGGHQLAA